MMGGSSLMTIAMVVMMGGMVAGAAVGPPASRRPEKSLALTTTPLTFLAPRMAPGPI
jgi:hypothetical protein